MIATKALEPRRAQQPLVHGWDGRRWGSSPSCEAESGVGRKRRVTRRAVANCSECLRNWSECRVTSSGSNRSAPGAPLVDGCEPNRLAVRGACRVRLTTVSRNLLATSSAHSGGSFVPHTRLSRSRSRREGGWHSELGEARRPLAIAAGVLSVSATMLAGCGAPEYTYVTNSTDRTYLKIPTTWRPIDPKAIARRAGPRHHRQGLRAAGFWFALRRRRHPVARPSVRAALRRARHLHRSCRTSRRRPRPDPPRPAARPLPPRFSRRQQQAAMDPASLFTGFTLMSDEVLTPGKGLRGVHSCSATASRGARPGHRPDPVPQR